MELTIDTGNIECPILKISGVIHLKDVEKFDDTLESLVTAPSIKKLIVDLSKLENWDDAAIASLLMFIKDWQNADNQIAIFGLNEELITDLKRKGMAIFFAIYKNLEEASDSLESI